MNSEQMSLESLAEAGERLNRVLNSVSFASS